MKCEYCGNNLSLEDKICPYCGKENMLAQKHNSDMDKYKEDYASVRKEVLSNSRRFNGITVRITIIAVLVALIACVIVGIGYKYDIRAEREERQIMAHISEHWAALDALIKARDYLGVYYYYRANNLPYSYNLDDYYMASTASGRYNELMDQIFSLREEGSYFEPDVCFERIASISQQLGEMKEPDSDFQKERYYSNPETVAYINDLADHSELIIKGYFGMSDEEMEEFRSLSKARKQILLEEGWNNER